MKGEAAMKRIIFLLILTISLFSSSVLYTAGNTSLADVFIASGSTANSGTTTPEPIVKVTPTVTPINVEEDNILKLEEVLTKIETSSPIKKLDFAQKRLELMYSQIEDIAEMIPFSMQESIRSQLSQTVIPPATATVNVFGYPVVLDHTLSQGEVDSMMRGFGFPVSKDEKMSQATLLFITPQEMLSNLNVLKKNKDVTLQTLKLAGEQLFYGLLLAEDAIKIQEEAVAVSDMQYKNAQSKHDLGMLSLNDLSFARIQNEQDILKLNSQKRSYKNMIYSLNKLMGVKITTTYEKTDGQISMTLAPNIDLEASIKSALENRAEIYSAKEDIKNYEQEFLITQMSYIEDDPEYESACLRVYMAKDKLVKLEEDIAAEIEDAFETINQNLNEVEKAKVELTNASITYSAIKDKFDAGYITKDMLDSAHMGVCAAEIKLAGAINTYNMSIEKFNLAIGIGPGFK
jgi:hypothetical protein